ncbi:glycine betaine/carnitine/choline ABC transporter ATP-binding protein [Marinilactibacillus psychrotolerans]|uniref:ABC-type quaternary amine transporter n=1 Tax=Marinilactibacillus psychrotolerans TaxID=191770 RepID=A0AAV3WQW1_9LACT|nr:ABC transporter ATP-binding protein [Marinilactibacillus psychrotolerans]GEL67984.1 glycine/betaine ABC transporter ATP-binding protein [Marinilactibacillus psychrotolerans]GEQ33283.1 glycine betaine/carnitine/choline ABC transporter ATP-binding protein [Marinilactibacillus psychrotolerans]GEQ35692.1 glycine betaine/carnitine/choline ABC transporter ATP-binding protein [Marinilactibacillus psychrotolerans]SDD29843.1 osmoprotectant transport system ATP-binding protein [Marinilactibacillus psy
MIKFEKVYKRYDDKAVVSDFTLNIKEGEFFVLIGPSGSGKTTTLKMINQLINLSEGYIRIQEKPISDFDLQELRWNIGYVLQQIALFPNMTVEENILIVPEMKKWSEEDMENRVIELLESVNMDPDKYRHRHISELSGGEQQRIGVIRALAADPDIILMDEPFSALDPITRNNLQKDVLKLQQKFKKTVVFVTHDMQEAISLGDRICLMNNGKIEQVGTANEILKNPANDFVRKFLQTGLPHYQEEKIVQHLIDGNYYSTTEIPANATISVADSVNDLIILLSKNEVVHVENSEDSSQIVINKNHLLDFLAYEATSSKEAEA